MSNQVSLTWWVFLPGVSVEHSEEVVVGAGHDCRVVAVPTAFKLVENAIVLVQRTKLWTQILVDLKQKVYLKLNLTDFVIFMLKYLVKIIVTENP